MPKGHEQLKAVKTRDGSGYLYASTKKEGKTTKKRVDRLTSCKTNTTALLKQKQQYIKKVYNIL